MPLGKYFCDYCEKEFQDTPVARKRHLQSTSHLRNKSLWYSSTTAANPTVAPPLCHRFLNTGFCPYAESCKYSHSHSLLNNNSNTTNNDNNSTNTSITGRGGIVRDMVGISMGNLPPSLRPPPEGVGYPTSTLPFVDWG